MKVNYDILKKHLEHIETLTDHLIQDLQNKETYTQRD